MGHQFLYDTISQSAGNKKWVSATAVADFGDSQALYRRPTVNGPHRIVVGAGTLHNRSGGAAHVALAVRFPTALWTAGQVTAAGAFTDDTSDAQNATTGDFSLHTRTDSGSGFLVSCEVLFNILGLVQSVAGDQLTPVLVLEYWNGAWVDMAGSVLFADTLIGSGTGEKVICFPQPSDWIMGGSGTGVPADRFNLRVRHTTAGAGTADPVASQLFVGFAKLELEAIADNGLVSLIRDHDYPFPPQGEALFPVFSVAERKNIVEVDLRAS